MNSSRERKDAMTRAVHAHRDALQATKKAVAEWASKHEGRRDAVAAGMLELLSDCVQDKDGNKTQEVVSELFDDYVELLDADQANTLAHALGNLGLAAQVLGHRRSMRAER